MLTTVGNSALPAGAILKKKPTLDDIASMLDEAVQSNAVAAGVLLRAGKRVLFLKRSDKEENFAGYWCIPGGGIDDGETPEDAAIREVREETGHAVAGGVHQISEVVTGSGRGTYVTFEANVGEEFVPKLDREHVAYAWARGDAPPQPLHPGVATLLTNLETGNQNQDREIKLAATDSARVLMALDRESVRTKDRDGRMRVATTNLSKATVNPYKGHEIPDWEALGLDPNRIYHLLRDPDEMKKAVASFNGVQLLRKHEPVSADDHRAWDIVGTTGTDAEFKDGYLRNSLHVWAKDAIDDIESDAKKELSCGYHYKPDMTAGTFDGMRFDGVMREIVGNHVALVKDGRAGPDVVVGDSNEEIKMNNADLAKKINAIATRQVTVGALVAYLRPRMALDAKPIGLAKVFGGVTGKSFKDKKPEIAKRLREAAKPQLAKDASLDDVEKVLDMLDGHEIDGGDESVSEAEHNAMEAAAHGQSNLDIPKKVGAEFVDKDKGKSFDAAAFSGFLKEKGMGEDDISAAMGMLPKPAVDEDPEAVDEDLSDEEKAKKAKEKEAADAKTAADKAAKDAEMKDMVSKGAMDAALKATSEVTEKRIREQFQGVRKAEHEVRPYVGDLTGMAFDSADDVYRHALSMLGVTDAKTVHASALPVILKMQKKPGERVAELTPSLGMDSASVSEAEKIAPGLAHIQIGT